MNAPLVCAECGYLKSSGDHEAGCHLANSLSEIWTRGTSEHERHDAELATLHRQLAIAREALEQLATLGREEAESDAMNTVMWVGETASDAIKSLDAAAQGREP